jgi:putative DNA primase/helicase
MNRQSKPYQILAVGESEDGDRFLEIEVLLEGQRYSRLMSMRAVQDSTDQAIKHLGAPLLTRSMKNEFLEEAQQAFQGRKPKFRVVTKSGWSKSAFVLPDGTCIPQTNGLETCMPQELRAYADNFRCRGTLKGWKRIPEVAKGNTRLMLAVALSFTGPVVDALRLEPPMIQLFGSPGSGKTSIGVASGSSWGGGSDGLFLQSWNHTPNNAERLAVAFHATLLVLDETRVAEQSHSGKAPAILQLIMRLAGGQMKGRMTDVSSPLRFTMPMLSLSNFSLDEMAEGGRAEIDDAHRGRLIDVPTPTVGVGAFENLHGFENHAALSAELHKIARSHHGMAARVFLKEFAEGLRDDRTFLIGWLERRRRWYLEQARRSMVSTSRDLERIHQKFATIYAAGALAIDYEILPWSKGELSKALARCERAHVDHVARFLSPVSPTRQQRPLHLLERLRQHVAQNRSTFVDLRKGLIPRNTSHKHESCPGYFNQRPDGSVELLFSNAILNQLCGGFSGVKRLKSQLSKSGHLISDSNRGVTRRLIWKNGDRVSVTAVHERAFENS